MSGIVGDVRYALRSLAKSRGYTAVAILSLGLALGITTTMLALVDATINPYMPFREPERLYSNAAFGGDWKHLSFDPLVLIAAEVVLLSVGLAACWIPARQATRSDPVVVLRAN